MKKTASELKTGSQSDSTNGRMSSLKWLETGQLVRVPDVIVGLMMDD